MIRRWAVELYFLLGAGALLTSLMLVFSLAGGWTPLVLLAAAVVLFVLSGVAADVRAEEEFQASLASSSDS